MLAAIRRAPSRVHRSDWSGCCARCQAERWALATGGMLARSCSGEHGERRFGEVWNLLAQAPGAASNWTNAEAERVSDPCKGLYPYALMRMLRRYRQLIVDEEVQDLRVSLADPAHRQSVFEKIIGLSWKQWPIALMRDLESTLTADLKPLVIAESGYHEERILAHLARDLFLNVHGYQGLQIEHAPWAFNRTVSDIARPLNEKEGGADIRVANQDSAEQPGDMDPQVIFRHLGYRAYANGSWLAKIESAVDTPAPIREWIQRVRASSLTQTELLDQESLPSRTWILMRGGPVNYEKTEFHLLFKFLRENFSHSNLGFDISSDEPSVSKDDPNDVFEDFIMGRRNVLMSGSIHDLLLEEFWIPINKTFVRIIDKNDFRDLSKFINRPRGQNVILFSDPCLSGCHPQPLAVVFRHAHGHSPAWQSSVPTIAPRVPATFSRRRGLRRLPGEGSLERRVCLPPLSAEEYLPLQQAVLSVQRLPFPARHRGRRHRTLPTQSFTPEPGSILHVGGVGNNRIGKLRSSAAKA